MEYEPPIAYMKDMVHWKGDKYNLNRYLCLNGLSNLGSVMFIFGLFTNIYSDHILRSLRSPGETNKYKIPRGGMFEYVSGANFFGEIVEWSGFAVATWSVPAAAFAFMTFSSLAPRAFHHHRYYKEKFEDYPKNRKALIPFIV